MIARAQQLAHTPYSEPKAAPQFMRQIGYDQYRGMRYRSDRRLWGAEQLPFQASMVMPGSVYARIVPINEVRGSSVHPFPFSRDHFEYDEPDLSRRVPEDLGYAGFELLYRFANGEPLKFMVFAGASYFRVISAGSRWGLSVRGASIDTGLDSGEEFPDFVEFWLVRPAASDTSLLIYALLNSPRLSGAFQFRITPGDATRVEVHSVLFARARIAQLGVAPLTSMYAYGENRPRPHGAWRPEVHDSDGLLVQTAAGEWVWRPLVNPPVLTLDGFSAGPRFGLLQRDTQFASYEDTEANYHRRPSAMVELLRGFHRGQIMLLEIPTANEFLDNIVAFWTPARAVPRGARLDQRYRLTFGPPTVGTTHLAQVVNTFVGRDVIDATSGVGQHRFTVDFQGGALVALKEDEAPDVHIAADSGFIQEHRIERVEATGFWRLSVLAVALDAQPLSLRAALTMRGRRISETWTYTLRSSTPRAEAD